RIALPEGIAPDEVKGATVAQHARREAAWTLLAASTSIAQHATNAAAESSFPRIGRNTRATVITWEQPKNAPLERVLIEVSGEQNYSRRVELQDEKGNAIASGEIYRVHLERRGERIDSE